MRKIEGIVVHRAEVDFDAYHRVIRRDGTIELRRHDSEVAPHACFYNPTTLAVAVEGDFASGEQAMHGVPTDSQMTALVALINAWKHVYGRSVWVLGHTELGPRGTTFPEKLTEAHSCPGSRLDMDKLRELID